MTRLTIEIEPEQHRQIKSLATLAGVSMKDYILEKILGSPLKDIESGEVHALKKKKGLYETISDSSSERIIYETLEGIEMAVQKINSYAESQGKTPKDILVSVNTAALIKEKKAKEALSHWPELKRLQETSSDLAPFDERSSRILEKHG